jgi:hypothetical protein
MAEGMDGGEADKAAKWKQYDFSSMSKYEGHGFNVQALKAAIIKDRSSVRISGLGECHLEQSMLLVIICQFEYSAISGSQFSVGGGGGGQQTLYLILQSPIFKMCGRCTDIWGEC